MKCVLLIAVLALGVLQSEGCSPVEGWMKKPESEVLSKVDLVVMGTFLRKDNSTMEVNGTTYYIIKITAQIDCVIRNANDVTVGREITIAEVRMGGFDSVPCTDVLANIHFGWPNALISIEPTDEEILTATDFEFETFNDQGPAFYNDTIKVDDVLKTCGFQMTTAPTGGSCPTGLAANETCMPLPTATTAGTVRPAFSVTALLGVLSLIGLFSSL